MSQLQESLRSRIHAQLNKDMSAKCQTSSTNEASYMNVYPRPPKFNRKFLHAKEEFGGKESELYSDSYGGGNSTGHCILDHKHATLVEGAFGWQRHHLTYQEQFLGNARLKLKVGHIRITERNG